MRLAKRETSVSILGTISCRRCWRSTRHLEVVIDTDQLKELWTEWLDKYYVSETVGDASTELAGRAETPADSEVEEGGGKMWRVRWRKKGIRGRMRGGGRGKEVGERR